MGTWGIVAGLALTVGVIAATLLAPLPERWTELAAGVAFWRRQSVRRRLRQRRCLLVLYAGLFAVAALVLVVWVLPSVLTEHPRIPKSADRHVAISNTRTGLVAMLAAIGAAGGLAYTARTYRLSREGHLTDRYSRAVEQLGDEKIEIRLGGIFALERLMRDNPSDQPMIMETLAAFIRQHAPRHVPAQSPPAPAPQHPAEDVQAILTVLSRRTPRDHDRPVRLANLDLTGAQLLGATLPGAVLSGVNLTDANLSAATLTGANLARSTLARAYLAEADLTGANLIGATLPAAHLVRADLTGADLLGANLTYANLYGATLVAGSLSEDQLASANNSDRITWIPASQQAR